MTQEAFLLKKYFTEQNFQLLKAKNFFHWNVSWKFLCWINVKLVFHEMLWKKNFTGYPSLYAGLLVLHLLLLLNPKLIIELLQI